MTYITNPETKCKQSTFQHRTAQRCWPAGGAGKAGYLPAIIPFDGAYIIAGFYDITNKNRLTCYLLNTRRDCYDQLKKDHPGAIIVFCPLIGLDLYRVVPGSTLAQQEIINNTVWSSNIELSRMKEVNSFYYPFLASPVHRIENGKQGSYYHHLAMDGLHLSEQIITSWAKQLVKAFGRN